jgi:hypothetical protein
MPALATYRAQVNNNSVTYPVASCACVAYEITFPIFSTFHNVYLHKLPWQLIICSNETDGKQGARKKLMGQTELCRRTYTLSRCSSSCSCCYSSSTTSRLRLLKRSDFTLSIQGTNLQALILWRVSLKIPLRISPRTLNIPTVELFAWLDQFLQDSTEKVGLSSYKQPTRCIKHPKFYFVTKLYMFWASTVPIIRSYQLYTWQLVCSMQVMWPLPRRVRFQRRLSRCTVTWT